MLLKCPYGIILPPGSPNETCLAIVGISSKLKKITKLLAPASSIEEATDFIFSTYGTGVVDGPFIMIKNSTRRGLRPPSRRCAADVYCVVGYI